MPARSESRSRPIRRPPLGSGRALRPNSDGLCSLSAVHKGWQVGAVNHHGLPTGPAIIAPDGPLGPASWPSPLSRCRTDPLKPPYNPNARRVYRAAGACRNARPGHTRSIVSQTEDRSWLGLETAARPRKRPRGADRRPPRRAPRGAASHWPGPGVPPCVPEVPRTQAPQPFRAPQAPRA
jgi:hypothetical protein